MEEEVLRGEDENDAEWKENMKGTSIRQAMVALIKRIDGKRYRVPRKMTEVLNHLPPGIIFNRPSILSQQNRRLSSQVAPQTR